MTHDTKRRPGRPKAIEPGANLTAWLRRSDIDAIMRRAIREDKSVSALVRELLKLPIRHD